MGLEEKTTFIGYEQLPIPIICFNKHVKINYLNSEAKEILKMINKSQVSFDDFENLIAIPLWLNIKTQEFIKSDKIRQNYIKRIQFGDTLCFLQLIFHKIIDRDDNTAEVKLIINDITEFLEPKEEMEKKIQEMKNSFEEQLVKLEKINSLSILAAGIAHDFNNILTIILGNIYIIKKYLKLSTNKEHNIYNKFSQIEKLTLQAQDLNQQLMNFSKEGVPIKKNIYIKNLIKKNANMV